MGIVYYRNQTHSWQLKRAATELADRTPKARGKSCSWARYAVEVHRARAEAARKSYSRWIEAHTLRDFRYFDGNNAWFKAIDEVQALFPGTKDWLISCSRPEGGHGRWVGFSGVGYSTWLRDSNTVGGNMQMRFQTFKGMWRNAVLYAREHTYFIPVQFRGDTVAAKTRAWRSALGQAMAAGWARYTGNDDQHWIASWDTGCR